jgi:uncharacterized membrane protein
MDIARLIRHGLVTGWQVRRAFPDTCLQAITQAIRQSESQHAGQIRFAVEGALEPRALWHGQSARDRAIEVFSQLRVWDTQHNNGVLVYVMLADQAVEIVTDRGIHACTRTHDWQHICRDMESAFARAQYQTGAVRGIEAITEMMRGQFPLQGHPPEPELADQPVMLG